jgi:hypothetical protein
LRKAWTEEYPYCKKHKPELLLIEANVGKNPDEYVTNIMQKKLAPHQGKKIEETIHYYEIGEKNEEKHGFQAYLDPQYIDDEKYRQKYFISPFKTILEQLGYDAEKVFQLQSSSPSSSQSPESITPVIRFERAWHMPSPRPFQTPAIAKLIEEECAGVPKEKIIDLFPYNATRDAFELLKSLPDSSVGVFLIDPPYSKKQAEDIYRDHGKEHGISMVSWESPKEYWTEFRKEIARVLEPEGKCITLAWNSQGTGKGLGFEITRILQVAHGGNRNDTIVTVDKKIKNE